MNLLDVMNQLEKSTSKTEVLRLIQQYGDRCDCILKYAPRFANDLEVVQLALSFDVRSIYYASDILKNDISLVLEVVQKNGRALQYVGDVMRNHRTVVLAAVRQEGLAIQYAMDTLWNDEELIAEAIQQNSDVIDWLDSLKNEYLII